MSMTTTMTTISHAKMNYLDYEEHMKNYCILSYLVLSFLHEKNTNLYMIISSIDMSY